MSTEREPMSDEPNSVAATDISSMRLLLSNLHHEITNQGGSEGELFREAEETIRWLLTEYLKRGEMIEWAE